MNRVGWLCFLALISSSRLVWLLSSTEPSILRHITLFCVSPASGIEYSTWLRESVISECLDGSPLCLAVTKTRTEPTVEHRGQNAMNSNNECTGIQIPVQALKNEKRDILKYKKRYDYVVLLRSRYRQVYDTIISFFQSTAQCFQNLVLTCCRSDERPQPSNADNEKIQLSGTV